MTKHPSPLVTTQPSPFALSFTGFANFEDLYSTKPSAITAAAGEPRRHAQQLHRLGEDLERDGSLVSSHVTGDIADLGSAPTPASISSRQLGQTGLVVAGCLELLGATATRFDVTVEQLNQQYKTDNLNNCAPAGTPPSAKLQHECQQARHTLKTGIRTVVGLLRNRDKLDTVRTLMDAGLVPLSALRYWPRLKNLVIKEVNSGHILDPGIALGLPPSAYSAAGQAALVDWIRTHGSAVRQLLEAGLTLNLPRPEDGKGYQLDLPLIDTESLKLEYILTIAAGAGVMGLKFTGGKEPALSGTVSDDHGNSAELGSDGWTVASAIATPGGGSVGTEWDKDGPWLTASHDAELPDGNDMEVDVKVRPPVKPGPPGEPDIPQPDPVGEFLHNLAHEPVAIAGAVKHTVTGAVGAFGDAWSGVGNQPGVLQPIEYGGLAAVAVVGIVGVAATG